ncbi:hypothetical protein K439DRAFT_1365228, partial [Ramaria rubella]
KYPIATISRLLDILSHKLSLGYDITCSFKGTLMRSSLGQKARELGLRMVVPAFHRHAHNQPCQLSFHILMASGFGLEDLEMCEQVFAASNAVAQLTQHATLFHQCQFIDLHFRQWDADKYENLGMMSLSNLTDTPLHIETLTSGREIAASQFSTWLQQEREYLISKKTKLESDVATVEYVELLNKYIDTK